MKSETVGDETEDWDACFNSKQMGQQLKVSPAIMAFPTWLGKLNW